MRQLQTIKQRISYLVVALSLLLALLPWHIVQAADTNLISNPSLESVDPSTNKPTDWLTDSWGGNQATFNHTTSGRTGARSVKTTVSAHSGGDAKWYFKPVSISANTKYTYSTHYKSNVPTEVVAQFTSNSNVQTYLWLNTASTSSSSWKNASYDFTTPSDAAKVSIFHVVARVGWLEVDDVSLVAKNITNPLPPTISLNVPTGSVSGVINLTANAASPGSAVAGVQFKINGSNAGEEDITAPYSYTWDTTSVANNTYTITATVRSTNGLTATSNPATLIVNNPAEEPPVDNDNLIANSSMETADPSNSAKPLNWLNNTWGTNSASFSYNTSGRSGNRSVTTTITNYSSGDAKWYFNSVAVTSGKTYLYRDYYKATVSQRVVVAFIDTSGNYSYHEVEGAPSANNWTQYQTQFTAPANAVKVTVFHLIDRVGSLTIDDAVLSVYAPSGTTDLIPNSSLELGGSTPTNWNANSWGTNAASFQYLTNEGYTGSRSVRVNINNYVSGDAKWYFTPITSLTPGQQYRFSVHFKTNVTAHPVAMFNKADGSTQYFGMPLPFTSSATEWQRYSETFSVPNDAVSVSVFMYIAENGWLQTDNYQISEYQSSGFNRPLLTLTFDDGHEDNVFTALPLLNQYGFKSTQCFATSFIENKPQAVANVMQFKNSGHEICSHTVTHPFMTTLNPTTLDYELRHSKEYLESIIGQSVPNFASPYGDYNASVNEVIMQYYQSHRTVDEGYNSKDNFNPYRLRVQNVLDTTSANQVASWISQAMADNTWLILVYHRIADDPGPYDSYTNIFAQHLEAIKASGITVKTYQDALTEVRAQL